MPSYVPNKLKELNHTQPEKPQYAPYPSAPQFMHSQKKKNQKDITECLSKKQTKRIQQIVGSFLYYIRAIDITLIKSLNTLATQ